MPLLDTFSLKDKVALVTGGAGLYGQAEGMTPGAYREANRDSGVPK